MRLRFGGRGVSLVVEDDGRGADAFATVPGHCLSNMYQRADELGESLD